MRTVLSAVLIAGHLAMLSAQTAQDKEVTAVVQRLFDCIAARDGAMILSTMLPDARITSVRDQATPSGVNASDMAARIGSSKGVLLERFTAAPKVLIRGRIAQLWGEYEFLRDGKLTHCGVDVVTLLATDTGWKIASLAYTTETTGCGGAQ